MLMLFRIAYTAVAPGTQGTGGTPVQGDGPQRRTDAAGLPAATALIWGA